MQLVQQLLNAANVVGMVMGANDGCELQAIGREVIQHRYCIARIDDRSVTFLVDDPEVVVLKRGDRMNVDK